MSVWLAGAGIRGGLVYGSTDELGYSAVEDVTSVHDLHATMLNRLGIIISDENREVVRDIEKSIRLLRGIEGQLQLGQIVENGFFIESHKSLPLQLCDLCAYAARKAGERKLGLTLKAIDATWASLVEPLVHRGDERLPDVLAWLTSMLDSRNRVPGS